MVRFSSSFVAKIVIVALLMFLILWSWYYAVFLYKNNEEAILSQVADTIEGVILPYKVARLVAQEAESELPIPLHEVTPSMVADTWKETRSGGRTHEGTDIFAEEGTPIFSATEGYVIRAGQNDLGGNIVLVIGPGGVRYYHAHLERIAQGIKLGTHVTTDTVLGYVGNTGNASTTPPHLHFGVYTRNGPVNPYPLLVPR